MKVLAVVVAVLALAGCGDEKTEEVVDCRGLAVAVCERACDCAPEGCVWEQGATSETADLEACASSAESTCGLIEKTPEEIRQCAEALDQLGVCEEGVFELRADLTTSPVCVNAF